MNFFNFSKITTRLRYLVIFLLFTLGMGCAPISFEQITDVSVDSPLLITQPNSDILGSFYFPLRNGKITYYQEDLETNQTSLFFQIQDSLGNFVNNLTNEELIIRENGIEISSYTLKANQQAIQHTADIVLAVDITGSMSSTIESAKLRLLNFIDSARAQGYRTRICVLTFGDYTVKHCNRFYNTDPNDPSSVADVNELKTQISQLRALRGLEDPGGMDLNENPMRALIDASLSPWASGSQRFVILITDDGFLFSPSNQGAVGALAPFMSEVKAAIDRSQLRVFAVTPSLPGYNSNFTVREGSTRVTHPSIVQMSNGEHFLFSDLISGRITLDTVLNRIISNILTTYQVDYVADEISGLSPHLPISERNFQIQVVGRSDLRVKVISKSSNLPNGRKEYPKEWILTDRPIKSDSIKVVLNDKLITQGFTLHGNQIRFNRAPEPRAKIEIEYEYAQLVDALATETILLPERVDIGSVSVFVNAVKAKKADLVFTKTLENRWTLRLSEEAITQDRFKIRELRGASVQIFQSK